jgi:dihydroorotate dehydrogenase
VGDAPLIIKTGEFGSPANLEQFLRAVAGAANGVVLLNCIVRPVLHANGSPVFSDQFRNVGIAGRAIHTASVAAVQSAVECVRQEKLGLEIIAVGGVSKTADVADFFGAGAAAVLMGSAPMYLPQIAAEAKQLHPEW